MGALSTIRICDFTGQLAGAGATRHLAALGAEIIRIEDPTNNGTWDALRGGPTASPPSPCPRAPGCDQLYDDPIRMRVGTGPPTVPRRPQTPQSRAPMKGAPGGPMKGGGMPMPGGRKPPGGGPPP